MAPRWKLIVEGLGKIERAEVEVRPLMLFVGENNSGKSYLASVLWGLLASPEQFLSPDPATAAPWNACYDWLQQRLEARTGAKSLYQLTREDRALLGGAFNEILAARKDNFVRQIFNSDSAAIARIEVDISSHEEPVRLLMEDMPSSDDDDLVNVNIMGQGTTLATRVSVRGKDKEFIKDRIIPSLLSMAIMGSASGSPLRVDGFRDARSPVFLPASRTGFMLLYKALISRQIRQLRQVERDREPRFDLTSPAIQFAELLAVDLKKEKGNYAEEADFLEAGLGGRVELVTGAVGVNEYVYYPSGSDSPLTMAMSSSLVTELAPIILVLRHMAGFPVLILEEPEAHLHPKLQRRLAQVIVRLIRKGLYVWITTHSENFCQQINNFIKLGALKPSRRAEAQQKLGYGEQDYLDLDDVTGYQFTLDETGERSTVTELQKTGRGMVMPTFNKELIALSREIDLLDQQASE